MAEKGVGGDGSYKSNKRVFSDRGREDLFLRAFGKKISVEDMQKIVDANEKLVRELKDGSK